MKNSNLTNLSFLISFIVLGASLLSGFMALESTHRLSESCSLNPDAVTVEAVTEQYQRCKSELKGMELEKQDKRLIMIASQLAPKEQLTDNTKNAFDAVFNDVSNQYYDQLPGHIRFLSILLGSLFFVWLLVYITLLFNFRL